MSKIKVSNAVLMITLIVLMSIYFVVRYSGSGDRSFKERVITFETNDISALTIHDPVKGTDVELVKEGTQWMLNKGGKLFTADSVVVSNLILQLGSLKTKLYAGKGEETWKKYELTDSTALRVSLKANDKDAGTLLIGKISYIQPSQGQQQSMPQFQQQQGEMTTYVRLDNEKDVYLVDGFIRMNFNREPDSYRDKKMVKVSPSDITRLVFSYPGEKMVAERNGNNWTLNGQLADSLKMARYTSTLSRLSGSVFIDEEVPAGEAPYALQVEGNNFSPIFLRAYPSPDTTILFLLNSTANPEAVFNGKNQNLFKKVMVSREELLPKAE